MRDPLIMRLIVQQVHRNLNEPQYVLPDAAYPVYPPSMIVSDNDCLLSATNLSPERAPVRLA